MLSEKSTFKHLLILQVVEIGHFLSKIAKNLKIFQFPIFSNTNYDPCVAPRGLNEHSKTAHISQQQKRIELTKNKDPYLEL